MTDIYNMAADYSDSLDWDAPFDGVEYINFFDGAAVATRNLAPGKPGATIAGSLTHGQGYTVFTSQTNYLQTEVLDTAELTVLSVFRSVGIAGNDVQAERSMIVSNFQNIGGQNLPIGVSLIAARPDQFSGIAGTINGETNNNTTGTIAADPNAWGLRALRISATQIVLDDLTTGTRTTTALAFPRAVAGRKFRIGGPYNGQYLGVNHQCVTALISRRISDNELFDLGDLARHHAASRGIAV